MKESFLKLVKDPGVLFSAANIFAFSQSGNIAALAFSTNVRDYVVGIKDHNTLLQMKTDFSVMKKMAENGPYQHEVLIVLSLTPECPSAPPKDCPNF